MYSRIILDVILDSERAEFGGGDYQSVMGEGGLKERIFKGGKG